MTVNWPYSLTGAIGGSPKERRNPRWPDHEKESSESATLPVNRRGFTTSASSGRLDNRENGAVTPGHDTPISTEKEYEAVRAEIERRSTVQQAVFVLNLTAVGALITLALKATPTASGAAGSSSHPSTPALQSDRAYLLALLIPYVGFALARLWLDHHEAIGRAGRYIRTTLESRSAASWETHLQAQGRSSRLNHYMFFIAYTLVFAGPGAVAIVATHPYAHGLGRSALWGAAVVMEALNLIGWTIACWAPTQRSISLKRLRTIFEPRVRAHFGWDALADKASEIEVAEYFVYERSDFQHWWMPWYYREEDAGRIEVQEKHGGCAIPLLDCGRLPTLADGPWDPKAETVSRFANEIAAVPMTFDVCLYSVKRKGEAVARIILDGNHHLAAALRSGNSFTARVFEIRGGPPDDTDVLQDLGRNWATDGRRPRTGRLVLGGERKRSRQRAKRSLRPALDTKCRASNPIVRHGARRTGPA
jgi:hypothetical protein